MFLIRTNIASPARWKLGGVIAQDFKTHRCNYSFSPATFIALLCWDPLLSYLDVEGNWVVAM